MKRKTIILKYFTDKDDEKTAYLPSHWVVCPRCQGEGVHDPAEFNGLTFKDFDSDPGFAEAYIEGVYDVPCEECNGRTTVLEVDEEACPAHLLEIYEAQLQEKAAERQQERYWGRIYDNAF